ncbi:hypothetical protein ACO1PF_06970 [Alkalibacterium sp. f15]|nr:hypothetical protein [Alkalibacterium sp. 20]OJF94656.1 small protein [Alkalibacterium sp. 20]
MNSKEKMLELIKEKKAGGGKSIQKKDTPKNDRKYMRKAPILFNK